MVAACGRSFESRKGWGGGGIWDLVSRLVAAARAALAQGEEQKGEEEVESEDPLPSGRPG